MPPPAVGCNYVLPGTNPLSLVPAVNSGYGYGNAGAPYGVFAGVPSESGGEATEKKIAGTSSRSTSSGSDSGSSSSSVSSSGSESKSEEKEEKKEEEKKKEPKNDKLDSSSECNVC